jgi:hypothetical protein
MENTIEFAIRTALHGAFKTLEKKTYDVERQDFLDVLLEDVMDILFPKQTKVSEVSVPTVEDAKIEEPAEEKKPEPEKKERKKPGPKPKPQPEPETAPEPAPEPVRQRVKPGPKPKPKHEGPVNVDKLTPTQTKKLKTAAETHKIDFNKNAILEYLNQLTKEEFDAKKLEEHAETYYTRVTEVPKEEENKEIDGIEIEFEGKKYIVNEATKRVYQQEFDVNGNPTVAVPVGYVGMATFKDMEPIYEEIMKG